MQKYHGFLFINFFRKIMIHNFILILCHVGFTILQSCLSSTAELCPCFKNKALQSNKI